MVVMGFALKPDLSSPSVSARPPTISFSPPSAPPEGASGTPGTKSQHSPQSHSHPSVSVSFSFSPEEMLSSPSPGCSLPPPPPSSSSPSPGRPPEKLGRKLNPRMERIKSHDLPLLLLLLLLSPPPLSLPLLEEPLPHLKKV